MPLSQTAEIQDESFFQQYHFIDEISGIPLSPGDLQVCRAESLDGDDDGIKEKTLIRFSGRDEKPRYYRISRIEEDSIVYLQPAKTVYGKLILLAGLLTAAWFAIDALIGGILD